MKGYIFILMFFFSTILVYSQQKKAFLIGIGDYKKELGWKKLNGHKDAEDIQNLLIERGGFNKGSIQIITNQEAKYTDVINKLDAFISNLQKNDTVVVYFSGHGQLIEDLNEDESNEDGLDEAFALIDTPNSDKEAKKGYKFEKHLTDDTLGEKYELIRKKIGELDMQIKITV